MDSKFEVYYFPIHGRGEPIRLLLAFAKANWESKFVSDWPNEKFNTEGLLYKQCPMLIEHTASGKENRLVQSCAITHYIVDLFNLETDDKFKNALLSSYFEGINEINDKISRYVHEGRRLNEDITETIKKVKDDQSIASFIQYNEDILAKNGANGYYLDNKMTYVDIIAFNIVDKYLHFPGLDDLFTKEKTPNIMKVYENVLNNPEIAAYLKSEKRQPYPSFNKK
ncbi:hypothetical protein BCR32DRAFT_291614 [Anaeromyces robustus]|uniref:glutathione transferase n=1 Tax=Anaeromyces robustus TaxID=1754192 RepID=A0A1Y1XE62_9FUNG|nr:hypothetical protein BCR32DRAFT_291614 [Anaeromyces robustus]|eukprot:ORX84029.1 hypothetical protein BCR32DRAFT_291614 [Anaeromyces robustus]